MDFSGDSKEEQLWPLLLRGVVPQCLHHGPAQARGEAVQWLQGGRHQPLGEQGDTTEVCSLHH